MRHFASSRFWQCFEALPARVQDHARRNYALLKQDPAHPSLQFKHVGGGRFRSVRIGLRYRALGVPDVTHRDPEILSGTTVFVGTRVPVKSLFDYLEAGDSLEEFLRQFPSVRKEQAVAVLDAACESVTADARSS